jgi:lipoyl-dependent peroxiredoxin
MALAQRTAAVVWEGTLASGSGDVTMDSGAIEHFPLDWASRSENAHGSTSPEELLAASHAGCYAMALTLVLANRGHKADRLEVTATTTLDELEVGYKISTSRLEVTGAVPGIEAGEFQEIAGEADQGCPVSNALRDNVAIEVDARLAG